VLNFAHNLFFGTVISHIIDSLRYLDLLSNTFSSDISVNLSSESQLQLFNLSTMASSVVFRSPLEL
ncbi:hypothetical protein PIB30_071189, partial [Stylosanthes scabra]|nr:hypothetical protein [Stylosanthes scabra]